MKHNFKTLNTFDMKQIIKHLQRFKQWILFVVICRLGFHDWENIDKHIPSPKEGEMITFSNLHRCRRCKKEKYLGMGTIC